MRIILIYPLGQWLTDPTGSPDPLGFALAAPDSLGHLIHWVKLVSAH